MKRHTTQKSIKELYGSRNVICLPYCAVQFLLNYESPNYYTTRAEYGWGCDIYTVEDSKGIGYALTTGYAPFGDLKVSYDLYSEWDNKAREILHDTKISNQRELLSVMTQQFVDAVLKANGR